MVSKVARTNPAKVVSSRAGRTNPVNKVVSNADLKSKTRHLYKRRAFPYWKFTSTDRHGALNLTYAHWSKPPETKCDEIVAPCATAGGRFRTRGHS